MIANRQSGLGSFGSVGYYGYVEMRSHNQVVPQERAVGANHLRFETADGDGVSRCQMPKPQTENFSGFKPEYSGDTRWGDVIVSIGAPGTTCCYAGAARSGTAVHMVEC
jgi:hypothetical protein